MTKPMTDERLAELEQIDSEVWPECGHHHYLFSELLAEVKRLREELAHHHCESCDGSAPECWKDKRS